MKVSVLADNIVRSGGFVAEHGLSLYLELDGMNLLFDTGQSDVFCRNAEKMGIDLTKTDCIALSHGHYDHCNGLLHFPWEKHAPPVHIQKSAFARRLMKVGTELQNIGISWLPGEHPEFRDHLRYVEGIRQLAPGVVLVGQIPMDEDARAAAAPFYVVAGTGGVEHDPMQDEQMLVLDREEGLYLFLGCSHPGILNCVDYAQELYPGKKIAALAAGMHLESASPQRLDAIISRFEELEIGTLMPMHCTGIVPICEMKRRLGDRCRILYTGETVEL